MTSRLQTSLAALRLTLALLTFCAALLIVVPAPTYEGWKLSIVVTEWGHVIAFIALLSFLPRWRRTTMGKTAALFGGVAFVLALSPLARAALLAESLPGDLRSAFGVAAPKTLPDASARSKPLVFLDLITRVRSPAVRIDSATFVVRDGIPVKLDLYRPVTAPASLPLVVMIHGGSWHGGMRGELAGLNYYLASRGYGVASMDYRLAPKYPHPAASEDVRTAIQFLKANAAGFGLDPSRIAFIGRSAGGHLCRRTFSGVGVSIAIPNRST